MSRPLPAPKHVRDLLEDLLGRTVNVAPADPLRAGDVHDCMVALYVDDGLKLTAVASMDFRLTVYAAAALGLVPPGGAKDFIDEHEISPLLGENAREVCNIFGAVLNHEGLPPIRLYQTFLPAEKPPNDAVGYLLALGRRLDLTVTIAGYGAGKLSVSLSA